MFSTIVKNLQNWISTLKSPLQHPVETSADQQLQSEFAQSVEKGLVVARNTQPCQKSPFTLDNESLRHRTKKSTSQNSSSSLDLGMPKRRRKNIESQEALSSTDFSHHKRSATDDQPQPNEDENEGDRLITDEHPLEVDPGRVLAVPAQQENMNDEINEAGLSRHRPSLKNELNEIDHQTDQIEDRNSPIHFGEITSTEKFGPAGPRNNHVAPSVTAKLPKSTHKKFGSENVEAELSRFIHDKSVGKDGKSKSEGPSGEPNSHESEDEGPETITTAVGLEQSRSVAAKTLRVVGRQQAAIKKRRREHDDMLKTQAKLAKRNRVEEHNSEDESRRQNTTSVGITMSEPEPSKQVKWPSRAALPTLLPKEFLEDGPLMCPPIPPMDISTKKTPTNNKLKLLHAKSKPPKDIKRGSISIRVLEKNRSLLPPKGSESSKLLRESWLAGHRGASFVPRKKLGGGFLRK